jgi:tellurite resistance protein
VDREEIMAELRTVARFDGRITTDERALLRGMDMHLLAFQDLLVRIDEDRVVDFDEFQQLRLTRQHVLDDLMRIALADDVISDDERQLLVRALELLPSLRPAPR